MGVRKPRPPAKPLSPPTPPGKKKKTGRPTKYTPELAAIVCSRVAAGETLIEICVDPDMPGESTVRLWDLTNLDGFTAIYERARLMQIEHEVDEIKVIADDQRRIKLRNRTQQLNKDGDVVNLIGDREFETVEHRRLQIEARKWRAGKIAWRNYGVRKDATEDDGSPGDIKVTIVGGLPDA